MGVHIQELQVGFLLGSLSLVLLLPISAGEDARAKHG